MAIRQVLTMENDILHQICTDVTEFNTDLSSLLDDMIDTVRSSQGSGLAAPQIGILKRVCVVLDSNYRCDNVSNAHYYTLVNPVILEQSDITDYEEDVEGCLSVPNKYGWVQRPRHVIVRAFDRYGQNFMLDAYGFQARIICHELDHLDGLLYSRLVTSYITEDEYMSIIHKNN